MRIAFFLALGLLFLLASSCEKVIDIELPNSEPTPVIEANIEEDSVCSALLSYSLNMFDSQDSITLITDAVVTITDDLGNSENLLYTGFGQYKGQLMKGAVGRTYTLKVEIEGKIYEATSSMLPPVPIDSITTEISDTTFNRVYKNVYAYYTDPVSSKNSYLFRYYYYPSVNSGGFTREHTFLLVDDNANGQVEKSLLFNEELQQGDVIIVELRNIDQAVFDYYSSIEDALSGGSFTSAAPANPDSNFSNGALGFFGAWSRQVEFFIVP